MAVFNVGSIGKLPAVFLPHGLEFPAGLDVAQNSGHICDLPGGAAVAFNASANTALSKSCVVASMYAS